MKPALTDMQQIFLIAGILVLAFIASYFTRRALARYSLHSSEKLNVDPTNYRFLKTASSFVIFTLAFIIIFHLLPGLEKIGTTLLASAGILSVIIGLAAQQTFGNIISGIFIFIYKPFRVGEYVQLNNGKNGIVEDINLRFTVIRNSENRRMVIPNTLISNEVVINSSMTANPVCSFLNFRIDYDADVDKAIGIIQKSVAAHPDFYDNRKKEMIIKGAPAAPVRLTNLDNFAMNLTAEVWSKTDSAAYQMKCDLFLVVKKEFDHAGIKMASPTRKIIIDKKE
jgi:small conductance mechanosensitive channel